VSMKIEPLAADTITPGHGQKDGEVEGYRGRERRERRLMHTNISSVSFEVEYICLGNGFTMK
jgi:hypothetical protein